MKLPDAPVPRMPESPCTNPLNVSIVREADGSVIVVKKGFRYAPNSLRTETPTSFVGKILAMPNMLRIRLGIQAAPETTAGPVYSIPTEHYIVIKAYITKWQMKVCRSYMKHMTASLHIEMTIRAFYSKSLGFDTTNICHYRYIISDMFIKSLLYLL